MAINLAKKDLFFYSAPALALAFAGMPIYIYAPDYFATEFNLSLSVLGLILLLLRFIDALQDPIIGRFSDRLKQKRLSMIQISAAGLVVSFYLLFQPFWQSEKLVLFWFTLFIFFTSLAYSVLSINLNTLGGLWSANSHQKTRITSTREGLTLIGLLFAVLLPPILQLSFSPSHSFLIVSFVLAVLMVFGLVFFQFWQVQFLVPINAQIKPSNQTPSFLSVYQSVSNSTKHFFLIYAISMLSSSIPAVLVLFFIRDRLDALELTGLFLAIYFLASSFGMPIWNQLSLLKGKFMAWLIAMAVATLSFIWAFFLSSGDVWQYALICLLSGIAFGADLSLPASILADKIQAEKQTESASLYFGMLSFIAKCALALGSAISFVILDAFDFEPNQINEKSALWALSFCYALLPCLIKLFALKLTHQQIKKGVI